MKITAKEDFINEDYMSVADEVHISSKDLSELLTSVLERQASFRFMAKGWSMSPFIKDGDIITISNLSDSIAGFGKPVAFICTHVKKLIVHRIISRNNNYYLIKGDRVFKPDGLIPRENILGIVTKIERGGKNIIFGLGPERYLIAFLSRTKVLFLILFIWRCIKISAKRFIRRE